MKYDILFLKYQIFYGNNDEEQPLNEIKQFKAYIFP